MTRSMLCYLVGFCVSIPGIPVFAQETGLGEGIHVPVFESGVSEMPARESSRPQASGIQFDQGDPTAQEQYMLELVNRARADPAAEARRWGIDLNEGLPPGTISTEPKPPLALHPDLIDSARAHSQWMLDYDTFSHTGSGGSAPSDRMAAAGYPFGGAWTAGENIAWSGSSGPIDETASTLVLHENLFLSPGHRVNILQGQFDEVGIGLLAGRFYQSGTDWNSFMGTQNFAASDATPGPLLTGVVYRDRNGNAFYDVGEGIQGVTVTLGSSGYYAVTSASGGYALPYAGAGTHQVLFSGGLVGSGESRSFIGGSVNVKLDLDVSAISAYGLSLSLSGPGSVTSSPAGIDCGSTCTAQFSAGSQVVLTAVPDAGASFVQWGGSCSGTGMTCTLSMTSARTAVATFESAPDPSVTRDTDWRITEIYVATMGYAPDDDGLRYWVEQVETVSRWTPDSVAESFFDQPLVEALYPVGQDYSVFIESLYLNIFGRAVDAVGYAYWMNALTSGTLSRDQMIIALVNGGWDNSSAEAKLDMRRFGYRIEVALAFAEYQYANAIHYNQLSSADQGALRAAGRQVLEGVTADSATRDAAIASIPGLLDGLR